MTEATKIIAEKYTFTGFGYDVELANVEMRRIELPGLPTEYHPVIDVDRLAMQEMQKHAAKQSGLTGNEIHFIRACFEKYFKKDLQAFASVMKVATKDVEKWEASDNQVAKLEVKAEKLLKDQIKHELWLVSKDQAKAKTKPHGDFYEPEKPIPNADSKESAPDKKPRKS